MKPFSIKTWNNNGVESIKCDGKKWINENYLETALGYKNLASNKTQFYSDEFKKGRCEMQDSEDFRSFRKFIAEELAVHLVIDIKTVNVAQLKIKLGFNQGDPIISITRINRLKTKKYFFG